MMERKDILHLLDENGIVYRIVEHPAVFTMEEMHALHLEQEDAVARNLFLRDDKKRNWYLLVLHGDRPADLKELRHMLGSRPLSFASESSLNELLGLQKGAVTPLGVLNDKEHLVQVVFDEEYRHQTIGVHPDSNTATIWMNCDDLVRLLELSGSSVRWLDIKNG